MRVFKFRMWDKRVKHWVKSFEIYFPKCELAGNFVDDKDIELKQFTGLKDKNGKEIYEGDIVDSKLYDGTRKNYEVEFRMGSFVVGLTELGKWIEDVIVIGNIYENPELLINSKG